MKLPVISGQQAVRPSGKPATNSTGKQAATCFCGAGIHPTAGYRSPSTMSSRRERFLPWSVRPD